MSATASGLLGWTLEEVTELEGLDEVRVPDHAPVLDADLLVRLVDRAQLLDSLVERLLRTTRIPQSASVSISTNSRIPIMSLRQQQQRTTPATETEPKHKRTGRQPHQPA